MAGGAEPANCPLERRQPATALRPGADGRYRYRMEPVYRSVVVAGRMLFFLQGLKISVSGTENIPRTGGAVLAVNHTGFMDFALAGSAARSARRNVRFMAKEEIFGNRFAGPLMRGMRHIPVDRGSGAGSFRAALQALKAGEIVGVFPEATISRSFELRPFKNGTVQLAAMAGVPLLPMTIWGSQRIWTKDHPKRLGRHHIPILISIGEPIPVARKDDFAAVTGHLRTAMQQMLHRQQADYPPLTGDERKYLPARLGGTAPTPDEAERLDSVEASGRPLGPS